MSLFLLRRPGQDWPLLLAVSGAGPSGRPLQPPGRHWPDRPEVVATLDPVSEGAWQGLNDHGVTAALLNRPQHAVPNRGLRSRGELVLEALDHAEAEAAAGALSDLAPQAFLPFNLVIADPRRAYWLRHDGSGAIRLHPIPDGLHMLAASELDDPTDATIRHGLPALRAAPAPPLDSDAGPAAFAQWIELLHAEAVGARQNTESSRRQPSAADTASGPGSSLIALPAYPGFNCRARWWYAQDDPTPANFAAVAL